MIHARYLFYFLFVQMIFETIKHSIKSHFRRIGDERKHSITRLAIDGIVNGLHELFTKFLALLIDIAVGPSAEIDALERALGVSFLRNNLFDEAVAVFVNNQRMACRQLADVFTLQVESGLQDRTLAGQNDNLIVLIIESRSNTPRVTNGKHLTASRQTTHNISTIEVGHGGFQDILHLDMIINVAGNLLVYKSSLLGLNVITFNFTVKPMPHQFEHNIGIAIDARTLSLFGNFLEQLLYIGHIEITAEA